MFEANGWLRWLFEGAPSFGVGLKGRQKENTECKQQENSSFFGGGALEKDRPTSCWFSFSEFPTPKPIQNPASAMQEDLKPCGVFSPGQAQAPKGFS